LVGPPGDVPYLALKVTAVTEGPISAMRCDSTGTGSHTQEDSGLQSDLPDTVFAFPRQRKEPLTHAQHVRNAVARLDQVVGGSIWNEIRAMSRQEEKPCLSREVSPLSRLERRTRRRGDHWGMDPVPYQTAWPGGTYS